MSDKPQMDWTQVAMNGGPPCFAVLDDEEGWYCGRAERWDGHDGEHQFVSLNELLDAHIRAVEAERDAMRFTAESLLAAFDTRPDGEPEWITQSTREAALNCARQDLGWPTRQGLQSAPPSYDNAIQFLQSLRDVSPEEAEEQRKTWEVLQQALNEGRND